MNELTLTDTQNLLDAIEKLYSLDDSILFETKALVIVNQLVPSEIPTFFYGDIQSRQFSHVFLPGCTGYTPEMYEVKRSHWDKHPLAWNMPQTLTGAYKVSDFLSEKSLHQLKEFYQQFLRVIDCEDQMTICLPNTTVPTPTNFGQQNHLLTLLSLNRSQRSFTERDRTILNLLRPHLFQAYSNAQRYYQLQQNLTQLHQSLDLSGIIFLNGLGQTKLIMAQAATWLQSYFPSHHGFNQLPEQLQSWIKHQSQPNINTPCLPLRLQQDNRQLTIRLVIDKPGEQYLLLLAEEQILSLLTALKLIGLSQREAEVMFWIVQGKQNKEIASELKVRYSTVRKHLENIYRKLNVESRTEAVSVALNKCGCLNLPPLL